MANRTEEYHIKVNNGQLQCQMWHSSGFGDTKIGLIILHPWAKLGGTMDDPVVLGMYNAAKQSGMFSCVVRYNARGVGSSVGPRKGGVQSDIQDCGEICQHLLTDIYNPPSHLYLAGYSYGSCVAASALARCPQVVGYITIAFPLGLLSRLFLGSRSHWQALAVPPAAALPKLLVTGSQDQFTSLGTYTDVVQQLRGQGQQQQQQQGQGQGQGQQGQQGQKQQQGSAGMDVKVMDGCDHFFVGRAKEVGDWVVHWVGQQEQGRAG